MQIVLRIIRKKKKQQRFWILVNKAEASFALGNMEEYQKVSAQAEATDHDD
ncbi:MAG: hypothetical protein WKG06_11245 [Segetibacter sp.]